MTVLTVRTWIGYIMYFKMPVIRENILIDPPGFRMFQQFVFGQLNPLFLLSRCLWWHCDGYFSDSLNPSHVLLLVLLPMMDPYVWYPNANKTGVYWWSMANHVYMAYIRIICIVIFRSVVWKGVCTKSVWPSGNDYENSYSELNDGPLKVRWCSELNDGHVPVCHVRLPC